MGKRRLSRELALQFLYQFDTSSEFSISKKIDFDEEIHLFWSTQDDPGFDSEVKKFMVILCKGVCENIDGVDRIITNYSDNWKLKRMAKIDRNILRIAVYEMLYLSDIPPAVTINEAIEVAKRFGTKESGSFINGVLDRIKLAKEKGELNYDFRNN